MKRVSFVRLFSTTESVPKPKCRWNKIHNKKIDKLHSERRFTSKPNHCIVNNTINNFSSYTQTSEEEYPLLFSLNQHTPTTKNNTNTIKNELESFFYHTRKHTKNTDQHQQDELKTKIRRKYENYSKLKVPYKHQKVIDKLSNNTDLIILRQDKVRDVTILVRHNYIQKCVSMLNTSYKQDY